MFKRLKTAIAVSALMLSSLSVFGSEQEASIPLSRGMPDADVALLFLAKTQDKIDYEKLAPLFSKDYAVEADAFKKQEIFEKVKPIIDARINPLKNGILFSKQVNVYLNTYDFNHKWFPLGGDFYFPDAPNCISGISYLPKNICFKYTNASKIKFLPSPDLEKSKTVEKYRVAGKFDKSFIDFTVSDIDKDKGTMNVTIKKLTIYDAKKTPLLILNDNQK